MEIAFTLIKTFLPYLISGIIGASIAWTIQGTRLDSAQLETQQCESSHKEYVNDQIAERLQREAELRRASDEASAKYVVAEAELRASVQNFDVYRRCVAAGKCGARVQYAPAACEPASGVPTTTGANGAGTDSVPVTGESAAKGSQGSVLADCAVATLRANHLQNLIEAQPGYFDER